MIEKLKKQNTWGECLEKLNEVIDAVNKLETMAKNTNTVLESLVQENNIHEKQIDELQMKVEPEKCETPAKNVQPDVKTRQENVQKETFVSIDEALKNAEKMISTANRYYLYVKYKHLIGKLCKFKWGQRCYYGILTNIKRKPTELPFESNGRAFSNCEPVKPDDDIIYRGE